MQRFQGFAVCGKIGYESKGRGFESRRAHQKEAVEKLLLFLRLRSALIYYGVVSNRF